jgi:hypothetical protein
MGFYDADFGTLLINQGQGSFYGASLKGQPVKGQVRRVKPVSLGSIPHYLMAKNNDSARLIKVTGVK